MVENLHAYRLVFNCGGYSARYCASALTNRTALRSLLSARKFTTKQLSADRLSALFGA